MKKVVSIAVLTPRSKSMLWMRRADNQKWTLPGGHIEEGESPADGALRELWEETGIRASKKDLKALGYDNVDDKYRVYAFTYTPDEIPVPTSENDPDGESDGEFLWFKDGERPEKQHVPEDKNVTLNLLKENLKKAQDPKGFHGILAASTPLGDKHVDHTPDLTAHPPAMQPEVDQYRSVVQGGPEMFTHVRGGGGITQKNVFMHEGQKYMVKPYHERVIRRVSGWQLFPIQGWAEMTNQSLYHSAGIGHLHQRVHVSEHNMQRNDRPPTLGYSSPRSQAIKAGQRQGGANEPALVIHMEPNLWDVPDTLYGRVNTEVPPWEPGRKTHITPKTDDLQKIALMDFLSNNLDRHQGNLMFRPDGTPLAIDHSRSFQYINTHANKWTRTHNQLRRDPDASDSFGQYMKAGTMGNFWGLEDWTSPRWTDTINRWWPEVSAQVHSTMLERLKQIKDPAVRQHIQQNFEARKKHLDEMARFDVQNYGYNDWHKHPVPHYLFGEVA